MRRRAQRVLDLAQVQQPLRLAQVGLHVLHQPDEDAVLAADVVEALDFGQELAELVGAAGEACEPGEPDEGRLFAGVVAVRWHCGGCGGLEVDWMGEETGIESQVGMAGLRC